MTYKMSHYISAIARLRQYDRVVLNCHGNIQFNGNFGYTVSFIWFWFYLLYLRAYYIWKFYLMSIDMHPCNRLWHYKEEFYLLSM